jgi:hypothetical protein
MRQILIEKYIEPSKETINNYLTSECWRDTNYKLHSFLGQPARIDFNKNKQIKFQIWCKKGTVHREKGLPAKIWYRHGKKVREEWFIEGIYIKRHRLHV